MVPIPIGEAQAYFEGLGIPLEPLGSARLTGVLSLSDDLITLTIAEDNDGTEVMIADRNPTR